MENIYARYSISKNNILLSLVILILLGCNNESKKSNAPIANKIAKVEKIEPRRRFNNFYDSLTLNGTIIQEKKISPVNFTRDTIKKNSNDAEILDVTILLNHRITQHYVRSKNPETQFDTCSSFLQFDGYSDKNQVVKCWEKFDFLKNPVLSFKNIDYYIGFAGPNPSCSGTLCTWNSYAIFRIDRNKTNLCILADWATQIKSGDFDKDGNLDFLNISNALDRKLSHFNSDSLGCETGQCLTITPTTFKKGKWQDLTDKSGKKYFFLIKLEAPYELDHDFKILDSYWPN